MFQGLSRIHTLELLARELAKRPARRSEDKPADLAALTPVQALVNGVVLAVDGQDSDTFATRSRSHERARHHQYFLIGDRDRLARLNRREHSFQGGRPRGGTDHDVRFGAGRNRQQTLRAAGEGG
jgi:hypothetical protein